MEEIRLHRFQNTIVAAIIALVISIVLVPRLLADDEKPAVGAKPSQIGKNLIGTWVLVGAPDEQSDVPVAVPRLKFFTGKHWTITQADKEGKVEFHHGGDYVVDGDEYAETIKYANENTAELIGATFKFKIVVEGDKYTQVGIGNPYTEVWKRAK